MKSWDKFQLYQRKSLVLKRASAKDWVKACRTSARDPTVHWMILKLFPAFRTLGLPKRLKDKDREIEQRLGVGAKMASGNSTQRIFKKLQQLGLVILVNVRSLCP